MPTLQFKGKSIIRTYHLTVPYRQLTPDPSRSLSPQPSLGDNLIIHGDNLLALKSLLPSFAGKVKCIYIDPPYNTGNEKWIYNDNVNSPMHQAWLKQVVDREDLTRHDKWLCMMWPRLVLLRELLREDGTIFISIDDNEVHQLRMMMDEIFGPENLVAQVTMLCNPKGRVLTQGFAQTHEYLVVYTKTLLSRDFSVEKTEEQIAEEYDLADSSGRFRLLELRNTHRQFGKHNRPNLHYPLFIDAATGNVFTIKKKGLIEVLPNWDDGFEGCWTWGSEKAERESNLLVGRKTGNSWKVFRKAYGAGARRKPTTVWLDAEVQTEKGQGALDEIMGERLFYAPKAVGLIKKVLFVTTEEDDLVLDSFAGSGTTGHSVLALNAEDGGNRKFILIEQEDYADGLTAERIRRIIRGVPDAKDEALREGYGGSFSFFTLGPALDDDAMLGGDVLPAYRDLARYVFFTATGEQLDESQIDESRWYVGESKQYEVYLLYQPNVEFLKRTPLNLSFAESLPQHGKTRLVIASHKYLDDDRLAEMRIEFCQLPFAIYRFRA